MSKFKKYSFWVALMGAVVLMVENLSAIFGFEFNKSIFESVFLSVCGILVVLGIIVNDKKDSRSLNQEEDEELVNKEAEYFDFENDNIKNKNQSDELEDQDSNDKN